MFTDIGKMLVTLGIVAVLAGLVMMTAQKPSAPGFLKWFGNLPLDVRVVRENFSFYFPLGTSILLSVVLSILLYLVNKFIR
ncbi:hypothetical protein CHL67_07220 [Prosthecochloris sp. GSB1]|uniref:DUF2905 domain-containing protein n=1 Tax=Prosthecochloris sp. GSB1 TaxID=281093 RepID=UPI000B8C8C76|nr:DUF2905 domain-containing protein [Prosthecochloris sp. GSB1]ASQ90742.1 hypothetical protein CHL67_07220 [Prosthecochloris sp. GSB1]